MWTHLQVDYWIWRTQYKFLRQLNKITGKSYVFKPLMKNSIGSNVESNLLITIHLHLFDIIIVVIEEIVSLIQYKFTSERCYCPIFSFNTRSNNQILFLTFSRNNVFSNKNTISASEATIHGRSYQISIIIPKNLDIPFMILQALS